MPRITNHELVNRLIVATDQDRIDWQATGRPQQFTASYAGKWTLLLSRVITGPGESAYWLEFKDSEGETLLAVSQADDERIPELHEMARRRAFKIDEALTDLLNEIDKPSK